jgi:hypothetical protein
MASIRMEVPLVCRDIGLLCLAVVLGVPTLATANPVKSRYTTIELKSCKVVERHQDGNTWTCAGLPAFPVYIAEGDLRTYMAFGRNGRKHRAASQTLAPFNTVFDVTGKRATVEWRFESRHGRDEPYATIVNYATQNDGGRGRVLVVTKIDTNQSCHVAYIDAVANSEAIVLARQAADESRKFKCSDEPRILGASGKSPM